MKSKDTQTHRSNEFAFSKPFFVVLYLLILLVYITSLIYTPELRQPGKLVLFTAVFIIHSLLHLIWLIRNFFFNSIWRILYFIIQGLLIFYIGMMNDLNGFTLGLYMGMAGEAVGVFWTNRRDIILSGLYFFILTSINTILIWGWQSFAENIPLFALMFMFVYTYVIAFMRLEASRNKSQTLLMELEEAHQKLSAYASRVEELTITEERQRMARELHDTLAQGLAGLIMQLEAVDSHLDNNNFNQAQAVTQQAMQRARITLTDARSAIQNLRTVEIEDQHLSNIFGQEIDRFMENTGIHTTYELSADEEKIPGSIIPDMVRILQEALRNIERHASASHVLVRLEANQNMLMLTIKDDGIGFNVSEAIKKPGRFGLNGIQERVKKIGGTLDIESTTQIGTRILVEVEL